MVKEEYFLAVKVDPESCRKVKGLLQANPGKIYTARKMAIALQLPMNRTDVHVRNVITHLLENDGCPIVSNSKGFWWAINANQLKHYLDGPAGLRQRRAGLDRRIRCVEALHDSMTENKTYSVPKHHMGSGLCTCGAEISYHETACKFCIAANTIKKVN